MIPAGIFTLALARSAKRSSLCILALFLSAATLPACGPTNDATKRIDAPNVSMAPPSADTPLPDASKEARAQTLMREIRCVVCENEPVSQSTADIAVSMRQAIRNQINEGKADGEVRDYFTDRYGQYVSFRPPTKGAGLLLWVFPFALLLSAGAFLGLRAFSSRKRDLAPLPDEGGGDLPS